MEGELQRRLLRDEHDEFALMRAIHEEYRDEVLQVSPTPCSDVDVRGA